MPVLGSKAAMSPASGLVKCNSKEILKSKQALLNDYQRSHLDTNFYNYLHDQLYFWITSNESTKMLMSSVAVLNLEVHYTATVNHCCFTTRNEQLLYPLKLATRNCYCSRKTNLNLFKLVSVNSRLAILISTLTSSVAKQSQIKMWCNYNDVNYY